MLHKIKEKINLQWGEKSCPQTLITLYSCVFTLRVKYLMSVLQLYSIIFVHFTIQEICMLNWWWFFCFLIPINDIVSAILWNTNLLCQSCTANQLKQERAWITTVRIMMSNHSWNHFLRVLKDSMFF